MNHILILNYFLFQISESIKDNESNIRSESKPIAAQIQSTVTPEIIQVLYNHSYKTFGY